MAFNNMNSTSFKEVAKEDLNDKIEVEVGDSKQPDFKPQVKLMRWDNEVNFSVRLQDFDSQSFSTSSDKISCEDQDRILEMYPIKKSELDGGGFEFEITLKKKPHTNVISFSLQSKDLDFFYQPELTDAQAQPLADKKGISIIQAKRILRPENVVGSYAVYHKEKKNNVVGGKEYKAGKAFHIYRPRIEDSKGEWVWGDLNIQNDLMTVTVPQEFLDNATYPVRHAAGATFGYTSVGASILGPSKDKFFGTRFSAPADMGTVTGASHAIVNDLNSDRVYKLVVVLQSTLNIVSNGVSTATTMPLDADQHPNSFTNSSFSSAPTLSASTDYVLGIIHNDASWANYSAYDTGTSAYYYFDGSNSYTTPTNPTDAVTTGDDNGGAGDSKLSIYITYTPAAGGSTYVGTKMLLGVGL